MTLRQSLEKEGYMRLSHFGPTKQEQATKNTKRRPRKHKKDSTTIVCVLFVWGFVFFVASPGLVGC